MGSLTPGPFHGSRGLPAVLLSLRRQPVTPPPWRRSRPVPPVAAAGGRPYCSPCVHAAPPLLPRRCLRPAVLPWLLWRPVMYLSWRRRRPVPSMADGRWPTGLFFMLWHPAAPACCPCRRPSHRLQWPVTGPAAFGDVAPRRSTLLAAPAAGRMLQALQCPTASPHRRQPAARGAETKLQKTHQQLVAFRH